MASNQALRTRVVAIGALVILVFIGEATYDSWRLHEQITVSNDRELKNLSRSLATDAERTLGEVDLLLTDVAGWAAGPGSTATSAATDVELAARARQVPQVSTLAITDANGRQIYRSGGNGKPLADVSDRPYFTLQRDEPNTGLYINAPVESRSAGTTALVLSRRINDAQGRFRGIVAATVTLEQLRDAYKAIDLGMSSNLLLTMNDGTLVIRQPVIANTEGKLKVPELVAIRSGQPINRMVSLLDGRPKLISAVGVGPWPLILAVQRDEIVALGPWVDEMRSAAIRTLLLTLATVVTVVAALRQLKRLEEAAEAQRKSASRYAMTMDAANEGHSEWNILDKTIFRSEKWCALHNLTEVDVVPSPDGPQWLTIHSDDIALLRETMNAHLDGRTPAVEIDYRVDHGTEWRWVHVRGRCQRDDSGAPISLFCSAVDITDRKREEAEKASFESRLQQTRRLEALGTLAGGIAHDFNNILGAILGFGEMAQQHAEPGTALRRYVDRVMQSGARARLLVRRILDFSRSGVSDRVLVNVQGVVEEAVAMLTPSVPPDIQVSARLEAGDAAVSGDATQLFQVAINLCTNAVQAMGDHGHIEISLEQRTLEVPVSLLQGDLGPGRYVRLEVADTGPGIPPEVLARIFDPFFTTKRGGEGTGLGLSVVHGVVSSLGGAIDVRTRETGGACVSVWLPVSGELAAQVTSPNAHSPEGHGEVVMVVDDEEALVRLAEELLAQLGYEPVGYPTAEAALAAFEANPGRFDAVLTDYMLPGLLGSELARQLLAARPDLPIILMSGNLSEQVEADVRSSGVRTTLNKPLALQELAEQLAALFKR